jgi:hypothetical protein
LDEFENETLFSESEDNEENNVKTSTSLNPIPHQDFGKLSPLFGSNCMPLVLGMNFSYNVEHMLKALFIKTHGLE